MEFVDSLKRWFFNNNSSAASSDARVPLLNANGTPKGSDTMANLASVLGVYFTGTISSNTELNRVSRCGIYAFRVEGSRCSDAAFNVDHTMLSIQVMYFSDSCLGCQIAFRANGEIKYRYISYSSTSPSWSQWVTK